MLEVSGIPFVIDVSSPETPKIVFPNQQYQRATYTDVLLMQLLIKLEEISQRLGESVEGVILEASTAEGQPLAKEVPKAGRKRATSKPTEEDTAQ